MIKFCFVLYYIHELIKSHIKNAIIFSDKQDEGRRKVKFNKSDERGKGIPGCMRRNYLKAETKTGRKSIYKLGKSSNFLPFSGRHLHLTTLLRP